MSNLLTVRQFAERHKAFSENSLRHIIFNATENQFSPAIRRIGRRVFIAEDAFFDVVEKLNSTKTKL